MCTYPAIRTISGRFNFPCNLCFHLPQNARVICISLPHELGWALINITSTLTWRTCWCLGICRACSRRRCQAGDWLQRSFLAGMRHTARDCLRRHPPADSETSSAGHQLAALHASLPPISPTNCWHWWLHHVVDHVSPPTMTKQYHTTIRSHRLMQSTGSLNLLLPNTSARQYHHVATNSSENSQQIAT